MTIDLKKAGVAALVSVSMLATAAAPANALGKSERDFLKGVAATVIVGSVINHARNQPQRQRQQYYAPQPQYYVQPAPVYTRQPHVVHQPTYQQARYRAPSIYSIPAAVSFNEYSPSLRRQIQYELSRYGYYNGAVDGVWGPNTYNAVRAYARRSGNAEALGSVRGSYGVYDGLIG